MNVVPHAKVMAAVLVTSLSFSIPARSATTLVDWGGNYVQNNQPFQGTVVTEIGIDLDGDGFLDDSRFGREFSTLDPMSPDPSVYSGTSDTFYGGWVVNTFNSLDPGMLQPNSAGVEQAGNLDRIAFQTQNVGSLDHTFTFLALWTKPHFLNDGDSNLVDFSTGGNFSLRAAQCTNCQPETHLHFLARDGAQIYVSQAFWGGTDPNEAGYQGPFPDGETVSYTFTPGSLWQAINPTGLDIGFDHGNYVTPTFSNVTGVGFFMDTLEPTQNNSQIFINSFSVDGFVVPEPSRALLLATGLIAGLALRRRKVV